MNTQNKPHQHAELIHAWADGKTIQTRLKESQEKWKDFLGSNLPLFNDKHFEYRIKPEKPSNDPWKPKEGDEYWALDNFGDVFFSIFSDRDDENRYSFGNCFRTRAEAEAAKERVKAALKGENVNIPTNVVRNVGSPEIDGEPLSDGEKELIKALRHAGRITDVYDYRTTVLVSANDNASGVYTHRQHIAFFTSSSDADDKLIISALKQIKAEQEASND